METDGEFLLAAVDVAQRTISGVRGCTRGAQGGEQGRAEIIVASAESDDDVGSIECLHVDSVMDPMNQQVEVDALRRSGFIRGYGGGAANRSVGIRWVVAHHAILGIVAQSSMQRQRNVALIAVGNRDYSTPRRDRRTIHGEVHNLVRRAVL